MTTPCYGIVTPPLCLADCHAQHAVLIFAAVVYCHAVYTGGVCRCLQVPASSGALCSGSAYWAKVATDSHEKMSELFIWLREAGTGWGWGYSWVWHDCVHYLHYLLDHYKRNKYEYEITPSMLTLTY